MKTRIIVHFLNEKLLFQPQYKGWFFWQAYMKPGVMYTHELGPSFSPVFLSTLDEALIFLDDRAFSSGSF